MRIKTFIYIHIHTHRICDSGGLHSFCDHVFPASRYASIRRCLGVFSATLFILLVCSFCFGSSRGLLKVRAQCVGRQAVTYVQAFSEL